MKKSLYLIAGILIGITLFGGSSVLAAGITAERSTNRIYVDGQEVRLTAYNINGNNYVMLRDVGKTVGFEVYWDGDAKCVQVESKKPYTGEAPVTSAEAKPVEQPAQTDVAAAKQDIVDRTNALRRAKDVAALRVNDKLMQAAQVARMRWPPAASTLTPVRMGARATPSPTASIPAKTFTTSRSCILSSSTKRSPRRWSSCGPTPGPTRTT